MSLIDALLLESTRKGVSLTTDNAPEQMKQYGRESFKTAAGTALDPAEGNRIFADWARRYRPF